MIRFDGQVAIVTGAGNGLGRSHALALAARGAKVVVNDLGGSRDGKGTSNDPAQAVADEIVAAGGEAIVDNANITVMTQVEAMVVAAMERWGRIDILVNNAGILRDKTFAKGSLEDFQAVVNVHLMGSVNCTKAVWPIMCEQKYGRVVMTTSSSGLYGNFGQTNYGAAKMGVVGLMNTLCLEGFKYGIHVNALAPCAATRMTEDLMSEQVLQLLKPESVTTGLLYLVSKNAPNRWILSAGAGTFARTIIYETGGIYLPPEKQTPEAVAEAAARITDTQDQKELVQGSEQTIKFLEKAAEALGVSLQ